MVRPATPLTLTRSKLAALKTRRTAGQTSSRCLTRVLLAYVAMMAETRMAIGLTCESFRKRLLNWSSRSRIRNFRCVTKCDILTTKRLARLKLWIWKALLMTLGPKYTFVEHIPCWLAEILSYGSICMQMSHANFKITKKDLELISWIKETVRQPWPWGFPGSGIVLCTKSIYCQRGGYNFEFSNRSLLWLWRGLVWWQLGFFYVEDNWTNQCTISLMNLFTTILWKNSE
jgi:hypothetical protein